MTLHSMLVWASGPPLSATSASTAPLPMVDLQSQADDSQPFYLLGSRQHKPQHGRQLFPGLVRGVPGGNSAARAGALDRVLHTRADVDPSKLRQLAAGGPIRTRCDDRGRRPDHRPGRLPLGAVGSGSGHGQGSVVQIPGPQNPQSPIPRFPVAKYALTSGFMEITYDTRGEGHPARALHIRSRIGPRRLPLARQADRRVERGEGEGREQDKQTLQIPAPSP